MKYNPHEEIDIVDERCKILYSTTKHIAHQKGLLHKTVIGGVINSESKTILVKQAGDRQDPGQYVSPVGGHIGAGESDEHALKRETYEELGLKNFKYKLLGKKIFKRNVIGRKENHLFIVYEVYSDGKISLNHEAVSFRAFSKDELKTELAKHPKKFGAAYLFVVKNFYPDLI